MVAAPEIPIEPLGFQIPRINWAPTPDDRSLGDEALRWCRENTIELDAWQELILGSSLGLRADGKFAAFEVAMCLPRQNGKGEVLMARELFGAAVLGERLIVHSAHEFATSSEHFRRMEDKIEEAGLQADLKPKTGIKRSHGEEGFEFRNGSRIRFRTRTKGGGRGFTGDLVILDEAQELAEFFHGTLLPIVSARSLKGNPQVFYAANAVDQMIHDNGIVFTRQRERGIAGEANIAYFEFSVDAPNPSELREDVAESPEAWAEANPSMGIRISAEHVAKELRSMDRRTFAVERLGVGDWPATTGVGTVIDLEVWDALQDANSVPDGAVVYIFDSKPDRGRSVIAAVGRRGDGNLHVEVGEQQDSVGWLVPRLEDLQRRRRPIAIVCDGTSPAASLIPELDRRGVRVTSLDSKQIAEACGMFFDAVSERKLRHKGQDELRQAIKGATRRDIGDRWVWNRRDSSADISPLVAITLGVWGLVKHEGGQAWTGSW